MSRLESVPVGKLRLDGGTQSRARDDQDAIAEYGEAYRRGDRLPPLRATWDGKEYWLYGGHHRIGGALIAGLSAVDCEIVDGTLDDAKWLALAENKDHGIRRTNEDKQKATKLALQKRPDLSNTVIADHVGVHPDTVAAYRKQMEPTIGISDSRTGKDGRKRNTSNIGKKKKTAAPKPESNGRHTSVKEPQPQDYDDVQPDPEEDVPSRQVDEDAEPVEATSAAQKDAVGLPIPEALAGVFDPDLEAVRQKCLTCCRQLRDALHEYAASPAGAQLRRRLSAEGRTDDDLRYRSKELRALMGLIEHWAPHVAVCPYCVAKKPKECGVCYGTGWVCQEAWDGAPADYKKVVLEGVS